MATMRRPEAQPAPGAAALATTTPAPTAPAAFAGPASPEPSEKASSPTLGATPPVGARGAISTSVPGATTLSPQERREAGMLAEIYSIIQSIEHVECAYVKNLVPNEDYQRVCQQLLAQYKTLQNGLRDKCPDVRTFTREHGMRCPLAEERISTGVPATALFASGATSTGKEALACFKASECFITLSDALKLQLTANDDILPLVRDLQASIVAIPNLPALRGLDRIAEWLVTLNAMRASDHLSQEQCRQLALDVEQAYNSMKVWLQEKI